MNFDKPKIMGVLNVTPDSFSDGGQHFHIGDAALRIQEMIKEGVDIIDVGAESTGPGSSDVSLNEELKRLAPLMNLIDDQELWRETVFSIDTYKADVAEFALKSGFQMVNDVTALRGDPKMLSVLVNYQPYVVLMYSKDSTPRTTKEWLIYDDVIASIKAFLVERASALIQAGFPEEKIIIDPGMGMFVSANPKYSFEIIDRLDELKTLGYPVMIGVSRKSFLGGEVSDRDELSAEWSLKAIKNGASIARIHHVKLLAEQIKLT